MTDRLAAGNTPKGRWPSPWRLNSRRTLWYRMVWVTEPLNLPPQEGVRIIGFARYMRIYWGPKVEAI